MAVTRVENSVLLEAPMRRFLHLLILALALMATATHAFAEYNEDAGERRGLSPLNKNEALLITECREPWAPAGDSVLGEFKRAWSYTGNGTKGVETVILIFRMEDGSYRAEWQGYTNEPYQFTFKWNPSAIAIVHTHPNNRSPEPEGNDKHVAEKYGVPIFTITNRGLYVYDPRTNRTSKVRDSLDWLKPCSEDARGILSLSR